MAYSDYGGYAYRNGERVESRSDATIGPAGDVFGSPGMWPGFAAYAAGGKEEYEKRKDWPSGHAVLGDGPIYIALYKQSSLTIVKAGNEIDLLDVAVDLPAEAIGSWEHEGKINRYLETAYFRDSEIPCIFELDDWKITVFWREEDNHYQYVEVVQPNGVRWHGWSGYGVGAGLEDCGYGYSTQDRDDVLWKLFSHNS